MNTNLDFYHYLYPLVRNVLFTLSLLSRRGLMWKGNTCVRIGYLQVHLWTDIPADGFCCCMVVSSSTELDFWLKNSLKLSNWGASLGKVTPHFFEAVSAITLIKAGTESLPSAECLQCGYWRSHLCSASVLQFLAVWLNFLCLWFCEERITPCLWVWWCVGSLILFLSETRWGFPAGKRAGVFMGIPLRVFSAGQDLLLWICVQWVMTL